MRKSLMALVALIATFAVAGIAVAQYAAPTATITGSTSGTKAGTKKKPTAVSVTTSFGYNAEQSRASADQIILNLPKNLVFNGRGLRSSQYCPATKINAQGVNSCPRGSEISVSNSPRVRNSVQAVLFPRLIPLNFTVRLFLGSRNEIAVHLVATTPGVNINKAIRGIVSAAGGSFGQKITIAIPPDLQQPVPGTYAGIKSANFTVKKLNIGSGRNRHPLFGLNGCPSNRQLLFGVRMTFVNNPNPPAAGFAEARDTSTCRK